MDKKQIGNLGETAVCDVLITKGYKISCRNFHSRYGEIDVIAENEKTLIFIEVKTRAKGSLIRGRESVTKSKQQKIILAAQGYLALFPSGKEIRFDVCELEHAGNKIVSIEILENAFY